MRKKKEDVLDELEEKSKQDKPVKKSVQRRRKIKKKKKNERWAGLILFIIMFFLGFVLWVSGEIKDGDYEGGRVVSPVEQEKKVVQPTKDEGVIIIE